MIFDEFVRWEGKTNSAAFRTIAALCRKEDVDLQIRGDRLCIGDDHQALVVVPGCSVGMIEDKIAVLVPGPGKDV